MALPIWGSYMKSCFNDKDLGISTEKFEKPKNLSIEVNCKDYKKDNDDSTSPGDDDIDDLGM